MLGGVNNLGLADLSSYGQDKDSTLSWCLATLESLRRPSGHHPEGGCPALYGWN